MSFLFSSGETEAPPIKLSPVKSNIEEANKHIQALCERVSHLEAEKDVLADQLHQKRAEFESLNRTLDQCQEHLSHRDIQNKNLEITAASREEIILELESHLVAHQRKSQAKSEALTSLEMLLAEKETVFERISAKVTEYQKVLEVKNQLLEVATENAVKLEEENVAWRRKENDLRDKVEILEEENRKLTKEREWRDSRSTVALEKILAYSSSIESLVGTLKEASNLDEEEKEVVKERDTNGIVETSHETKREEIQRVFENVKAKKLTREETYVVESPEPSVESPENDLPDERGEALTNGWNEASSPNASSDDLPLQNNLPDESVDGLTNGWNEASEPNVSYEDLPVQNGHPSIEEVQCYAPSVPVALVAEEETSATVLSEVNNVDTQHPIVEDSQHPAVEDSQHPIVEVDDETKNTLDEQEDSSVVHREENPFLVTSPLTMGASTRIRGEDRIASILLFDSAETAINEIVDDFSDADDKDDQRERFEPVTTPLQAAEEEGEEEVEEEEESDGWEEVNGDSLQPSSMDEVVSNGIYERDTYSGSDPDSKKINPTEFFV